MNEKTNNNDYDLIIMKESNEKSLVRLDYEWRANSILPQASSINEHNVHDDHDGYSNNNNNSEETFKLIKKIFLLFHPVHRNNNWLTWIFAPQEHIVSLLSIS